MKISIRNVCNLLTRKPITWDGAADIPQSAIQQAEADLKALPRFEATSEPMKFIRDHPQVFVAVLPNGQEFLVNTEGFNYCRYVGRL